MKHEHKFVIPVEWVVISENEGYEVTTIRILRCECGEEIKR